MSLTLREGLRQRGHEARLFASTAAPLQGLPIIADDTCWGTTGPAHRVTQALNPVAAAALRRVIGDYRPDVVHVRMFMTQLSPLILPVLRHVPALFHAVNYDLICPINTKRLPDGTPCQHRPGWACRRDGCIPAVGVLRTKVQHGLMRRWLDAFDLIVANSRWTGDRLAAEGIAVGEVVHNGVPVRDPRPPLTHPPTAAFAGRLVGKKGVDVLLRAWAGVVAAVPGARLLIAGDGPERAKLERLAAESGVGESVEFLGHLPRAEMERALDRCWVQAAPSLWEEPFGLVAAEAGMRGTAALVSAHGGMAEVIDEGVTGYATPPGDVAALAEALIRILSDRNLAERLGVAGRRRVLDLFTEDRVVERFIELYGGLIKV